MLLAEKCMTQWEHRFKPCSFAGRKHWREKRELSGAIAATSNLVCHCIIFQSWCYNRAFYSAVCQLMQQDFFPIFEMNNAFDPWSARYFLSMMTDLKLRHPMSPTKDGDVIKWAIQFILEQEEIPIIRRDVKCAEIAMNYIDQGNQNFHSSSWRCSLELYTQGVMHAPPDSKELALAYGNRSAVLYNRGFYEDCMLDIGRALNIGYPDKMVARLYVRKARCLYALNDDKISPEVEKVVAEARKWLEKMDDGNKKNMNNLLDKLSTKSSTQKPFKELDYREFLPYTPTDNPSIIGASAAVEIKYSKKFGRHLVARKNIQAGEILSMHKAYVSVIESDYIMEYCWNCLKRIRAGVPCRECHTVIYCSEVCRDIAWQDYHDIECRTIPTMVHEGMSKWELLILKMTAKACKEAESSENLKKMLTEIDNTEDPITKCYSGKSFDASKYASVYTSTRGFESSLGIACKSVFILYCLASTTKICGRENSNLRNLLNNQSAIFIGTLIMKHFYICEANARSIFGFDRHGKKLEFGCTINPFMDLMNHSCDPMICEVAAGDIRAAVTLQRIKKGEQIFTSFGPAFWKNTVDERQGFMQKYFSKCSCKPCLQNWGPFSMPSLPSSQVSVPLPVVILLDHLSHESFDSFLLRFPIAKIPSLISFLSTLMNEHQGIAEYPTQEMIVLKYFILTLYNRVSLMFTKN